MDIRVLLLCIYWAISLGPQPSYAQDDFGCVESLVLPKTGIFAARAEGSGSVHALITVADSGGLKRLDMNGGDHALEGEVMMAMKASRFKPRCAGQMLSFVFDFTILEENPSDHVFPPMIKVVPPNRFELTFRRVKGVVDAAPRE